MKRRQGMNTCISVSQNLRAQVDSEIAMYSVELCCAVLLLWTQSQFEIFPLMNVIYQQNVCIYYQHFWFQKFSAISVSFSFVFHQLIFHHSWKFFGARTCHTFLDPASHFHFWKFHDFFYLHLILLRDCTMVLYCYVCWLMLFLPICLWWCWWFSHILPSGMCAGWERGGTKLSNKSETF